MRRWRTCIHKRTSAYVVIASFFRPVAILRRVAGWRNRLQLLATLSVHSALCLCRGFPAARTVCVPAAHVWPLRHQLSRNARWSALLSSGFARRRPINDARGRRRGIDAVSIRFLKGPRAPRKRGGQGEQKDNTRKLQCGRYPLYIVHLFPKRSHKLVCGEPCRLSVPSTCVSHNNQKSDNLRDWTALEI